MTKISKMSGFKSTILQCTWYSNGEYLLNVDLYTMSTILLHTKLYHGSVSLFPTSTIQC
jgi:hypothetical protein